MSDAIDRYMRAVAAGATPADGTRREALSELDTIAADAWDGLALLASNATESELLAKARQLVELVEQQRLAIHEHRAASKVIDALGRGLAAVATQDASGELAAEQEPSRCSVCKRLNPTLIWAGRHLRTRCAEDAGVRPRGKIGE